jgi:RNA polymerase sigma factor (sigma-70 family)
MQEQESQPRDGDEFADLIRQVRAGDDLAAEELVRRYEPEIRLEVRGWLRLRHPKLRRAFDSMDICQAVLASFFVRAAVGEFEIESPRQLLPLLVGIARNKLSEQVRFHQRRRRDVRRVETADPAREIPGGTDETPSQIVARRDLLDAVRGRLSEEERRIAELRSQGIDWAGVSTTMGNTPEARRKQFTRAIARVGKELGLDLADD